MDHDESLRYLSSLGQFGIKPGTERLAVVLERLGHPEERFLALHIAGTNGKGSTAAMSASLLLWAGGPNETHAVGLYTSPHLCRVRERIKLSATGRSGPRLRDCSEVELASALSQVRAAAEA